MSRAIVTLSLAALVGGGVALEGGSRLVRRTIPHEDPGPPFYARVGPQVFDDGQWVAIPFYRPPSCIPAEFNLLQFFDFPGPGGPGAFGCPLLVSGFLLIEPDAPLGTFPRRVEVGGSDVPVWFVPSAAFAGATADGGLTIGELEDLQPVRGLASPFHETLHPSADEELIVIVARGTLEDGRMFLFQVTHLQGEAKSLRIAFGAE